MKRVYLDYAAGAPMRKEVQKAINEVSGFANPSAIYKEGAEARRALEGARESIAKSVGVRNHEIVFVSGSTEANNLAVSGWAKANPKSNIITTKIEHPSILEPIKKLGKQGFKISYLLVDKEGFVNIKEAEPLLRGSASKKRLVSLTWVNSDIGTIQPIDELSEIIKDKALLHIDVSHTEGLFNLKNIANITDMITISSLKIGGPKGIAGLIVRSGIKIEPIIYGGGQEKGLRAGTENAALAVGFARALELAQKERKKESERLIKLRDKIISEVLGNIKDVKLTGPSGKNRLSNHASFAFKNVDGEELAVRLDQKGFSVATGTACSATKKEISEAIKAIGLPKDYQKGTLRITLGKDTTEKDIENFVKALIKVIKL